MSARNLSWIIVRCCYYMHFLKECYIQNFLNLSVHGAIELGIFLLEQYVHKDFWDFDSAILIYHTCITFKRFNILLIMGDFKYWNSCLKEQLLSPFIDYVDSKSEVLNLGLSWEASNSIFRILNISQRWLKIAVETCLTQVYLLHTLLYFMSH